MRKPNRSAGRARPPEPPAGLASRRVAAELIEGVLHHGRPLDEALEAALAGVAERDRALVRMLVGTVLRRHGTLRAVVGTFLTRAPKGGPRLDAALLLGAAQILFLDVPDHAAVDLSVRLATSDHAARHYAGLVNAVLRKVAAEGQAVLAGLADPGIDAPDWLMARWRAAYGAEVAAAIAEAHRHEAALDLTVKADAAGWAERLGGQVLPTGSVRLLAKGPVPQLEGFAQGAWWVQDAAAALPARLLGDVRGLRVADLCAAPGGKTLQLATAGASVTAVDRADSRLDRLRQNLERTGLTAEIVCADVLAFAGGTFDAVLLDAPCSATGTIRRHPDVAWTKGPQDIASLAELQAALLDRAVQLVKPGGRLVYCTCSLEPEEGPDQIEALLARRPGVTRLPIEAAAIGADPAWITAAGDLRTLPCHLPDADPRLAGLDGFFAARLAIG
ncbi:RsmB/NOP family class I SAM-dependent RNA methyltransferase [Blastochloris sulfoviridis]|uniref:RsmB/NOP family class I SAM-dependent RNA methyltransferase n=1 Tax=Blastochloris sulfoviridis TaxID=50712 RepID=A0A5M6I513_9HYPH|nr:RsmB/NOP family class I SAM-dependent RNA methyltransferase [Blastochloris sulfoviridis]KAA5603321.1 RsmB/NOP family class I SAM-dependent RNA methyltransferase [Blastochloris sulfoviridis]